MAWTSRLQQLLVIQLLRIKPRTSADHAVADLCSVWKKNPNATSIIEPLRDSAPNPGEGGYEGSNVSVCVQLSYRPTPSKFAASCSPIPSDPSC